MSLAVFPFKLGVYLSLVVAALMAYRLAQATEFGVRGSELLHRLIGAIAGIALVSASTMFALHMSTKHSLKAALVLSPLFLATAIFGLFVAFRVACAGREKARAMLSQLSRRGF